MNVPAVVAGAADAAIIVALHMPMDVVVLDVVFDQNEAWPPACEVKPCEDIEFRALDVDGDKIAVARRA
jgi:hypothetical protein